MRYDYAWTRGNGSTKEGNPNIQRKILQRDLACRGSNTEKSTLAPLNSARLDPLRVPVSNTHPPTQANSSSSTLLGLPAALNQGARKCATVLASHLTYRCSQSPIVCLCLYPRRSPVVLGLQILLCQVDSTHAKIVVTQVHLDDLGAGQSSVFLSFERSSRFNSVESLSTKSHVTVSHAVSGRALKRTRGGLWIFMQSVEPPTSPRLHCTLHHAPHARAQPLIPVCQITTLPCIWAPPHSPNLKTPPLAPRMTNRVGRPLPNGVQAIALGLA